MPYMVGRFQIEEGLAVFNAYRAKIVAEDQLVNHRISWMLWFEATLFAVWGALAIPARVATSGSYSVGSALLAISIFGIIAAFLSYTSMAAALQEIEDVRSRYKTAYPELWNSGDLIPRLHAGKNIFGSGMLFAQAMPVIFVVIHAMACAYVISEYFIVSG